jgi:hypothetical protein
VNADDDEPDWDRVAAACEAVLLRMIEDQQEGDDADGGLLPGVDRRASD